MWVVIYHQVYTAVFFVALEGTWTFWGSQVSKFFFHLAHIFTCITYLHWDGDCSLKLSKLDLFYFVGTTLTVEQASMVAQKVKNLPAMQETGVRSLGWEDPLEKGLSIHSSILVWKIPWTEEPGGLQSMGSQRVGHDWATNTATSLSFTLMVEAVSWSWEQ